MEFLSLRRRRSSARNVLSDEERGEMDVFAGYGNSEMYVLYTRVNCEMFDICSLVPVRRVHTVTPFRPRSRGRVLLMNV